ncbi:DUF4422 domain-containing protein [Lactobacillus murinus]|uniref:DUF4422 domain-containing protein n=2 Tax=Ligilactobacillus murinus TaxID=1622 RepID=A0AAE6WGZ6_9LACO|nr:DUF4422 domain-containing protein [Ligilactobacillus murinus]NEF83500.1 DUF4422 domain-containing protein [Ligilactobacillus murinus]NEF85703.1 DUF4422 domain-containing protein [Ligilactobacillus murinus]NEF88059.1 DUF4422 domain-containing protein [Ligilactobacillus murinus]NEF90373.1 DUF4422 domain-containing protein [Ligilactobacillus murinus]NEF92619.1 DUF4422 domain-containing protein [Ligilactobacillus murinus]
MTMYVITHKLNNYKLPAGYRNLLVGANKKRIDSAQYLTDNQGDNISDKNSSYCELTGMYWVWKNIDQVQGNVGISHYRRYFSDKSKLAEYIETVVTGKVIPLSLSRADDYLKDYDWIVPKKIALEDGEKNLYENYVNAHYKKDLEATKSAIKKLYPEYEATFDKVFTSNKFSQFNMCYTSKDEYVAYCQWLFDILFEVEKQIDITNYDTYQGRVFGFLAERLFNVWLQHGGNKNIKYLSVFDLRTRSREYIKQRLIGGTKKH